MATFDTIPFPLVELQPVSNAQNEWLALSLRIAETAGAAASGLHAVLTDATLLDAIAPLHCIVLLETPAQLTPDLLALLPPNRVWLAIASDAIADDKGRRHTQQLHEEGYRILIDGALPDGAHLPPGVQARSLWVGGDSNIPAGKNALLAQFGPHLARGVDSGARLAECLRGGFEWFSGNWALHPLAARDPNDGTSRKRLLTLLGLLARDADSRELEALLKQDPALSYHLLKLVNSAAFAPSAVITSFGQAINLLGRRQLQRWLQLLLYARQQADGHANPLLPLAALRAAQLESLTRQQGGDRDAQDLAFMTGVFSLLDVLFGMTMEKIVGTLGLAPAVSDALLRRAGRLGALLGLIEANAPAAYALAAQEIDPAQWWQSQLDGYRWAIQVSRNL